MKRGAFHVLGRIPWYMHLSELLLGSAWKNDDDFHRQRDRTRERLLILYRKVLEFEMNCVCAAASSWNNAAKNVVGWHGLGTLVREIEDLDAEIANLIATYIARGVAETITRHNDDLKLDPTGADECAGRDGSVASIGSVGGPESHPAFQTDALTPEPELVKPSTVRV